MTGKQPCRPGRNLTHLQGGERVSRGGVGAVMCPYVPWDPPTSRRDTCPEAGATLPFRGAGLVGMGTPCTARTMSHLGWMNDGGVEPN